jgi:RNA polymerase sigma factor (sigma-70 family)
MNEIPDHHLIARVVVYDDHHAFKQLVLRYQSDIRCLLLRLTHGDQTLADDLAQETFIRAYRYLKKYKSQAKFSTWLYRISFNLFKTNCTKKDKINYVDELHPSILPEIASRMDDIHHRIDINDAMQYLTVSERMVVVLYYDKDMTHLQIAEILEMPLGTIKTHIARAKVKLKKILTPQYV